LGEIVDSPKPRGYYLYEEILSFEVDDDLCMRNAWFGTWACIVRLNLEWITACVKNVILKIKVKCERNSPCRG
jgi:hypothetical protein